MTIYMGLTKQGGVYIFKDYQKKGGKFFFKDCYQLLKRRGLSHYSIAELNSKGVSKVKKINKKEAEELIKKQLINKYHIKDEWWGRDYEKDKS